MVQRVREYSVSLEGLQRILDTNIKSAMPTLFTPLEFGRKKEWHDIILDIGLSKPVSYCFVERNPARNRIHPVITEVSGEIVQPTFHMVYNFRKNCEPLIDFYLFKPIPNGRPNKAQVIAFSVPVKNVDVKYGYLPACEHGSVVPRVAEASPSFRIASSEGGLERHLVLRER